MSEATHGLPVSIVIPTYQRGQVLVDTVRHLLALAQPAAEILLIDQTREHEPVVSAALRRSTGPEPSAGSACPRHRSRTR